MKTSYKIIVGSILSILVYLAIFQPRFYLYTYEYFFKDYYTVFFENNDEVTELKIPKKYFHPFGMKEPYFKPADTILLRVPYKEYGMDEEINGGNWIFDIEYLSKSKFLEIKENRLSGKDYSSKILSGIGNYYFDPIEYSKEYYVEYSSRNPACKVWVYEDQSLVVKFLIDKKKISELSFYLEKSEKVLESLRVN
ncbi:hypothetical protein [Spartinivicinus ruber]|uniref:hypothetical protein n=1 Tax=Spartinivicinus ruber TaxID=2683272 RepID=UPI0013D58467|nr:hypothetical protein [Spartinivicinus ruber]